MTQEQWKFLQDIGKLIDFAAANNYTLTEAEGLRTPAQAWMNSLPAGSKIEATAPDGTTYEYSDTVGGKGISHSLHLRGLAFDMNLILPTGGLAQTVEDYRPLGEFWESLDPINRWGGHFSTRPDADHFERNAP